jgi:uncharacterized protein YndB with AHSA1/START domain
MSRVVTSIAVACPVGRVFAYVTTPGHWPEWHPSSLAVRGATDHSLAVSERVTEDIRVAGVRATAEWTVRERDEPRRWVIEGTVARGGGGVLTYTLTPTPAGTLFEREFAYTLASPLLRLLDPLVIRPRIAAASRRALAQLRVRLEQPGR